MIYPNETEYIKKARNYNVIPVYKKYFADTETPATVFLKLRSIKENEMFLLESVEGIKRLARYSFIGAGYSHLIEFSNAVFRVFNNQEGSNGFNPQLSKTTKPLEMLEKFLSDYKVFKDPDLGHFLGGAVGYLSYDIVRYFENINIQRKETGFPEMMLYITDCIIVFDHLLNTVTIVATVKNDTPGLGHKEAYNRSVAKIKYLEKQIFGPSKYKDSDKKGADYGLFYQHEPDKKSFKNFVSSNFTKESFIDAVHKAKQYINEGEVFQLVLSQRFETYLPLGPVNTFNIYRILRNLNPSPYMYYLSFKDFKIIGSSPEPLAKITGRKIITCPIAGTRKRGKNRNDDKKTITGLLNDDKEKAEHNMLVDLSRNDLGRVCEYGSVKVKKYMRAEKYSHVIHLVSRVEGILRNDQSIFNALRSTFPAGTLTGAPKIRAMQLISELEPERRGPYGGVVGYFGYDGSLDCCITIRTAVIKNNRVLIQAGAGIVYDSVAENEYYETLNKAKALINAVTGGNNNYE